jgi:hypothetical protein
LIIVTEEAKVLLGTIEHPEGTVLRLDPVAQDQATEQVTLGFAPGEPHAEDQIVEQEGEEVLRARLASRLPPRLRRCRTTLPEEASMGATPQRLAKEASLLNL